MSLNIKNPETYRLANRIAQVTGESLTQAVTIALRERLSRIEDPDHLAQELLNLGADCAARLNQPWLSLDHGDFLYNEAGLSE